ncbi:Urease accessory protein UreH [Arboricoccus pini]|uniref:Urease accessory protein UreD n=1 Tax=Arboricoccus pini TaxID=1963835 RepID=A0A212S310_9PROT|nr:urease accessory protein UreD [Arboricoccus pini]SNB79525.1 Urease accessory protein UreH [Arboricoccus pini]
MDAPIPVEPAALDLVFRRAQADTRLVRRRVAYPYAIQAPLRPARAAAGCHVIVQSASGGLFSGEQLRQCLAVESGADARLELPAATTVHAMRDGGQAEVEVEVEIAPGGCLAYLARPLILFPQSQVTQRFRFRLAAGATLIFRDGFMTHDPWAAGEHFRLLANEIDLCSAAGRRILLDRQSVTGLALAAGGPGIIGPYRAFGTLLLASLRPAPWTELAQSLQAVEMPGLHVAATPLRREAGLLVRLAALDGGGLDDGMLRFTERLEAIQAELPGP